MTYRDSSKVFDVFAFDGYTTWLQPFQVFQICNGPKHVLKLQCHIWQQNHMSSNNRIFRFVHWGNNKHYSFKLTINMFIQPSSKHVQKVCKRIHARVTSHLKHRGATRHCHHPLLSVTRLLNEVASCMTSLSRPPITSLPTHIPFPTAPPPTPGLQYFHWSCANFDDQLVLPEQMQHEES
jgi:hypothetical protein